MKKFSVLKTLSKHKKPIIAFSAAAIIATAVYTDYLVSNNSDKSISEYIYTSTTDAGTKILGEAKMVDANKDNQKADDDTYFQTALINRERSRDEALQTLQVVVDSAESMPDVKDRALVEMMQIATDIETETTVEEMIRAKGFEDCLAIISGQNINVVVKSPGLLNSEVAQITEIVQNETGFDIENIRIVEKSKLQA